MRLRTIAAIILSVVAAASFFAFVIVAWGRLYADLLYLAFLTVMLAFMGANVLSLFFGAPFVPMKEEAVDEMMLLAGIGPGDKVADLGSGDGRVLIAAAKRGATAEGWEINPVLWLLSRLNVRQAGVSRAVRVHLGSYWKQALGRFDVVTLYLLTPHMQRMQEKLQAELRPGGRVVSHRFTFPGWPVRSTNGKKTYLYTKSVKDS